MKAKKEMLGIGETFSRAMAGFEKVFPVYAVYLGISLLILGLIALLAFLSYSVFKGIVGWVLIVSLGVPAFVALIYWQLWGNLAAIYAAQNPKASKKLCYKKAQGLGPRYFFVLASQGLLALGLMVFFLAPGIMFMVFTSFASYIVVREKTGILATLMKSRAYVKGYGWPVLGRVLLCSLCGIAVSMVPILGGIVAAVLVGPFQIAFYNTVYEDLRRIKGPKPAAGKGPGQGILVGWAVAGWGIAAVGIVILLLRSGMPGMG